MRIEKMQRLVTSLKLRSNSAHEFFEAIQQELTKSPCAKEAVSRLRNSYSIVQYANFNYAEEQLLSEILEELE